MPIASQNSYLIHHYVFLAVPASKIAEVQYAEDFWCPEVL
jgi:hypothetical protein